MTFRSQHAFNRNIKSRTLCQAELRARIKQLFKLISCLRLDNYKPVYLNNKKPNTVSKFETDFGFIQCPYGVAA